MRALRLESLNAQDLPWRKSGVKPSISGLEERKEKQSHLPAADYWSKWMEGGKRPLALQRLIPKARTGAPRQFIYFFLKISREHLIVYCLKKTAEVTGIIRIEDYILKVKIRHG